MKKIGVLLIAVFGYMSTVIAQDLQKNIFGVRAGLNVAMLSTSNTLLLTHPEPTLGFHAGVSYQRLLLPNNPLYLETGISFFRKDAVSESDNLTLRLNTSQLIVPVLVNYHLDLGADFAFVPALGLYYSYGLGGSKEVSGDSGDPVYDAKFKASQEDDIIYGSKGEYNRSNLGLRVVVGFDWRRVNLSVGYDMDLTNSSKVTNTENGVSITDSASSKFSVFTVSLGYCF